MDTPKPKIAIHNAGGWVFESTKGSSLIETDTRGEVLKKYGIYSIPEMIFKSHLLLKKDDFEIVINPLESIPFCFKEILRKNSFGEMKAFPSQQWSKHQDGTFINFEGNVEKMQSREEKIDWTFTCLYNGTIKNAKSIEKTEEQIDYGHLTDQSIKIDFFNDPILYEDELSDFGFSKLLTKVRVNQHSFFLLLRNFVLVNNVAIRIIDHRYFGYLDRDYIIREFSHREMSVKDFKMKFPWIQQVSKTKVMEVVNQIPVIKKFNEKITF